MPRRKLYRKKATGARRRPALRRRRQQLTNVNRGLQPISSRYICKMKYSEVITTNAITGDYAFNLNSIFDPNRTGAGHQPYGHDTLFTLYNRYRVIACGWRIQFLPSTAGIPITVTSFPANELVVFPTGSEAKENPRTRYITQTVGGGAMTLKGKQYIPALVGRTKSQYMSDDRYQAQMGTSPNELAILNLQAFTSGDVPSSNTLQILLEYTVEFFDAKHLAQS